VTPRAGSEPSLELDARGRRLRAALAAALVKAHAPERRLVHRWLDSWSGLGLVVAGMTHQGWDVELTAYAARDWRANFFPVGIAHSIVGGSAWEPTPWRAVQQAAWETLRNAA
jgi:hypothetical protein